jgi:hypothetical protein
MVEQKGMQSIALHRLHRIAGKSVIITGRGQTDGLWRLAGAWDDSLWMRRWVRGKAES